MRAMEIGLGRRIGRQWAAKGQMEFRSSIKDGQLDINHDVMLGSVKSTTQKGNPHSRRFSKLNHLLKITNYHKGP